MIRSLPRTGVRAASTLAILALALTGCSPSSTPSNGSDGGEPVAGGTLRLVATAGNAANLDPQTNEGASVDRPRWAALYNKLMGMDANGVPQPELAASITSNAEATKWTVKLRSDAMLHLAKRPYNADDLIFSVKRIIDPATGAKGKDALRFIDPNGIRKVDDFTVEFDLPTPYGAVPEAFTQNYIWMVPKDFDPKKPDGTGPFTLESYTPGQQSVMHRFDDYWGDVAHVEKLVISDVKDSAAQVNALRGGQADIIDAVPPAEVKSIETAGSLKVLRSPSWQYFPIIMDVNVAPYSDVRVRQALRLVADRKQMVDVALNGYGVVANDFASRTTACKQPDVPQREQNIDEAKRLLAEAGQSNLKLELVTTNGTAGMAEAAPVFAEQAKKAGIEVTVRNLDANTYLEKYGQWPFAVDWITDDYRGSVQRTLLPGGSYNNSHFNDPEFNDLAAKAFATPDPAVRCDIFAQMKKIEYDRGSQIVWGFSDSIHGHSAKVHGLEPSISGNELEYLNRVWIK